MCIFSYFSLKILHKLKVSFNFFLLFLVLKVNFSHLLCLLIVTTPQRGFFLLLWLVIFYCELILNGGGFHMSLALLGFGGFPSE